MKKVIAILIASTLLVACSTSPTGRSQLVFMPESQMITMGVQSFHKLLEETPRLEDAAINQYVQCIGDAIIQLPSVQVASSDWEIVVFDDSGANAFALPGGKIGVNKGLLSVATTPGQVAAVIGHEVGHVLARHGNERVSQAFAANQGLSLLEGWLGTTDYKNQGAIMSALGVGTQVGVLLPFGRTQESEADTIGVELMARAGFDPEESVALWQNMARNSRSGTPEFLSTHPSHATRIERLGKEAADAALLYHQSGRKPQCELNKPPPPNKS
ncbi:MAG TPA: M48 family peptidase [Chromatiales bacterium]|nr:M48 family peptidase [Chromatiales bacterium]